MKKAFDVDTLAKENFFETLPKKALRLQRRRRKITS